MKLKLTNNGKTADLYLYGEIGWENRAGDFAKELAATTAETINIRINSPGGSVFDGIAIFNVLRNHKARKIANVEGMCLSAATYPALAADEIVMNEGAMWMIHNVAGMAFGGAEELRKQAENIERVEQQVVNIYTKATGKDEAEIKSLMNAETWWNAEEAVAFGWADRTEEWKVENLAFDLDKFKNVPDSIKSNTAPPTVRQVERALKTAGLSQAEAKEIASQYATRNARRDVETKHQNNRRDGDWLNEIADAMRDRAKLWK